MSDHPAIEIFAGQSKTWTLSVTRSGAPFSLVGAQLVFEVKVGDDDPDPALIVKSVGDGITVLPETDDTIGMAKLRLSPADTIGAFAPVPGRYRCSCWATFDTGEREPLVEPRDFVIRSPLVILPDPPFFCSADVVLP